MRSMSRFLMVLLTVTAAACSDPGVNELNSEGTLDPTSIDFGLVRTTDTKRVTVTLANIGRTSMTLTGIDSSAGMSRAFRVPQLPGSIAPGASVPLVFTFAPDELGLKEGKFTIHTDSTKTPALELAVKGTGVESAVTVKPEELVFNTLEVGSQQTLPLTLKNEGETTENVKVLSEAQIGMFQLALPSGQAAFSLAPGESIDLPVTFAPQLVGDFSETLELKLCDKCTVYPVSLKGNAIDSFVTLAPKDCLEFGYVNPGSALTKSVSVGNLGPKALTILEASIATGASVFTLESTELQPIAENGKQVLNITYHPAAQTSDTGSMKIVTDNTRTPSLNVCLHGTGGGPDVHVTPTALAFGQTAAGVSRDRSVRIENRGIAGAGQDPAASDLLILGAQIIIPSGSTTQVGEFSVNWGALPLTVGAGSATPKLVTYLPVDAGDDTAILELTTNDVDSPKVQVTLTGTGRVLAPCDLKIYPSTNTLDFGVIAPNHKAQLQAAIENVGTDVCLIDSMALTSSPALAFQLTETPPDLISLDPGARRFITVEFAPTVTANGFTGAIQFNVSNPANPHREIDLKGVSAKTCLLFAPEAIDFGNVTVGCGSGTRSVRIYNSCTGTIDIKSITYAEDPANRFAVVGPSTFPQPTTTSQSVHFDVRYKPVAVGADRGGVYVQTSERAEPYLIPFSGTGVNGGATQTDVWTQTVTPADILFVVDNSGSMGDEQAALAQNFGSFIAYAQQLEVDFHMAVTTTDIDTPGTPAAPGMGNFSHPGSNPKVITSQTPNLATVFGGNISVGTNGSSTECGFEGARLALDPAKLATDNADFLRPEAILSIIMVSDETEQSAQSYNYYFAYFMGIKGFRNPNLLTVSVVVTDTNPATERYAKLAQDTGGVIADIATTNWAKDLEKISLFAFGRRNHFMLTSTPADPAQIACSIDNVDVPATLGTISQWTYTPSANSVDFNPLSMPEPGQMLQCTYPVACIP